jgi:hypothetical protein
MVGCGLQRRTVIATAAAPWLLVGCGAAEVQTFPSLAAARRAIEGLASGYKSSSGWTLAQTLNHAAQSIEYSLHGFPAAKSALFQRSAGAAAFAVFEARGKMSHSLSEPIPGAPALDAAAPLPAAMARSLQALRDFEAHTGALAPHFAYGALDKAQYTRAHLMHLANHWTEVTAASAPTPSTTSVAT